ncbi:MAG TPA: signal peptide peptidase SppA [Candidatus Eisenbacteria bacterium]|nr:signal peptide peptidase SppA [Candidatus Eisenbacteria bacterium]
MPVSFFRVVAAVLFGIVLFFLGLCAAVYVKWGQAPSVKKDSILVLNLGGPFPEYPAGGFTSGLLADPFPSIHSVREQLVKAAVDERVRGVLLVVDRPGAGYAGLDEMRSGIRKVREAGKPVWAWSDFVDLKGLYLASACDSFFVHPTGYTFLGGMYVERTYVAGTLEKLGIEPQFARVESYKSAVETFTRKDMSPQDREMTGWLLSDIYPRVTRTIAEGFNPPLRPVSDPSPMMPEISAIVAAMERTVMHAGDLVGFGLADGAREWDQMRDALPRAKGDKKPRLLAASTYEQVPATKVGLKGKKTIAVVHAEGIIAGEESSSDPFFGLTMGYRSVNRDLQSALDDEEVAGVILRVDSRGGDALTSDRISRMVEVVNRKKPVVASMVDVAASGGYNIAYRARRIVAGENTITGSIGIYTGKVSAHDLYNKLGVTKDGLGVGPGGDFYSDYRTWTESEYAKVSRSNWDAYRMWIENIARTRKLEVSDVDSVGRGRVWTGRQALERKLIDELGDLDAAVAAVKQEAGIDSAETVTLDHYPKPEGFLAMLLGMSPRGLPGALADRWARDRVESWRAMQGAELQVLDLPLP